MQGVHGWAEGGDPEEFGWVFDETGSNVNAYTLSYETPDRDAATNHGVPETVLDAYEKAGVDDTHSYGFGLCDFLQSM